MPFFKAIFHNFLPHNPAKSTTTIFNGFCRQNLHKLPLVANCSTAAASINANGKTKDGKVPALSAKQLVKQIVDRFAQQQKQFAVPWGDQEALNSALYSFRKLLAEGVKPEFLLDACLQKEQLFRRLIKSGRRMHEILLVFVQNFAITHEEAVRLFAQSSDELASETADSIQRRLSIFSGRGLLAGHNQLCRAVKRCPELLFAASAQQMDACLEQLANFFTLGEINKLMANTPHICLLDPKELEAKYEYIYFHMGIPGGELVESKQWMNLELDQVMARHKLLGKCGKYIFPDPKRPQFKKENPTVDRIFDTSDLDFATDVAGITHEEWVVFQQLCDQEKELDDKERPYERIRPSQRKRFERQLKARRELTEGEIE